MSETADHSGVPIHPPLWFVAMLLLGVVIDDRGRALPIFADDRMRWFAVIPAVLGIGLVAWGRATMIRHGTNVNPTQPSTTIVESGPFRFTRNPLYVGLTLLYVGLSLGFNTWWSILLLVPVWLAMHFLVVRREEAYLAAKFGQTYDKYRRRVRRYL